VTLRIRQAMSVSPRIGVSLPKRSICCIPNTLPPFLSSLCLTDVPTPDKRAIGDEYTIPFFALDLNTIALEHPQFLDIGGNTGTPNSFTGVNLDDLTGGVYNAKNLLEGNNVACFAFQAAVLEAPDLLKGLVEDVTGAVSKIVDGLGNSLVELGCPQLEKLDQSQFEGFPGYANLKGDGTY
jgi:hypothetical protein